MGLRRYHIGRWLPFIGYGGRDGPPPRNRPGRAAVFWTSPPIHEERKTGTANDLRAEKNNAYFVFNLLIINYINQYFNIHLYLIGFIIYNR